MANNSRANHPHAPSAAYRGNRMKLAAGDRRLAGDEKGNYGFRARMPF